MKSSKTVDEIVKNTILTELSILSKISILMKISILTKISIDKNISFDQNINFDHIVTSTILSKWQNIPTTPCLPPPWKWLLEAYFLYQNEIHIACNEN